MICHWLPDGKLHCAVGRTHAADKHSKATSVPRLVNYSGKILDKLGKPVPGIAGVFLAILERRARRGTALDGKPERHRQQDGPLYRKTRHQETYGLPLERFSTQASDRTRC